MFLRIFGLFFDQPKWLWAKSFSFQCRSFCSRQSDSLKSELHASHTVEHQTFHFAGKVLKAERFTCQDTHMNFLSIDLSSNLAWKNNWESWDFWRNQSWKWTPKKTTGFQSSHFRTNLKCIISKVHSRLLPEPYYWHWSQLVPSWFPPFIGICTSASSASFLLGLLGFQERKKV